MGMDEDEADSFEVVEEERRGGGIGGEGLVMDIFPLAVNRFFNGGLEIVEEEGVLSLDRALDSDEDSIHRRFLSTGEADIFFL